MEEWVKQEISRVGARWDKRTSAPVPSSWVHLQTTLTNSPSGSPFRQRSFTVASCPHIGSALQQSLRAPPIDSALLLSLRLPPTDKALQQSFCPPPFRQRSATVPPGLLIDKALPLSLRVPLQTKLCNSPSGSPYRQSSPTVPPGPPTDNALQQSRRVFL
jgi:hypothetical protein